MENMQPGQIISPTSPGGEQPIRDNVQPIQSNAAFSSVTSPQPPATVATSPAPQSYANTEPPTEMPVVPTSIPAQIDSMPIISADSGSGDQHSLQAQAETFAWSAAEYVRHEKHGMWYGLYVLGTMLVTALVYFTTKDILSSIIVFVAILGLILFASRKPSVQEYAIDGDMLKVGNKTYYLHDFKAFSVIKEGQVAEVMLRPLKRLFPMVSVYVGPDQLDTLADYLADFLPFEPHVPDAVDSLLRRIRF